uniref:Guanylate-binding protein N-terminal domain-containing protein n=1 Tax=Lactuca sativa TaxID=4236 RepID=A0A9R1XVV7_LACSA|nr:hypothetical protein LSAT_V11C200065210 [Lactuca sativa]
MRKELKKNVDLAAEEADIREEDVLKEKDAFENLKKLAAKSLTETVNQLIDTVNQNLFEGRMKMPNRRPDHQESLMRSNIGRPGHNRSREALDRLLETNNFPEFTGRGQNRSGAPLKAADNVIISQHQHAAASQIQARETDIHALSELTRYEELLMAGTAFEELVNAHKDVITGIWVWRTPVEMDIDGFKTSFFYLDTEGFESIGKSNIYDDRCLSFSYSLIFALATVLSSVLIYNFRETFFQTRNIREADISRLSFAVELAEEFYGRVNVTFEQLGGKMSAHFVSEQSRRDDLESLGYVFFLPWQGLKGATKKQKYDKICEKKVSIPIENHHLEFATYFKYCRSLTFDQKPNYGFLKRLFRDLLTREGFDFDYIFDWVILKHHQSEKNKPHMTRLRAMVPRDEFRRRRNKAVTIVQVLWMNYVCKVFKKMIRNKGEFVQIS